MWLVSAYGTVVAASWALSTFRSEATLVRGRSFLGLNAVFFAGELARLMLTSGKVASVGLILFAVATLASMPLRAWWLISRYDETDVLHILEQSLSQLRIDYSREATGYQIRAKTAVGKIAIRPLVARRAILRITFDDPAPKEALLKSLLAKRFGRLVPRPHIRLR